MATPTTLRNRLGNPVSGEDFWPRTDVVDPLVQDLREDRGSRRLFALRRIGKTSVLKEVEHRLQASGMTVVHVDVQGLNRFRDFLAKVFEKLPIDDRMQQARQRITANPVTKTLLVGAWARLTGQPASQTEAGFQNEFDHSAAWAGDIEAVLSAAGPVVLIIDELPFMLRNMMRDGYRALDAERFLATLRSWRMNAGVRMLLSGSIGLHQLQRNDGAHVADHIGDVIPVSLAPLPRSQAVAMVEALARGAGAAEWSPDLSEAVVEASAETWPIFLQYGFNAAHRRSARDAAAVRVAIESLVRQQLDETLYGQFRTRLSRYDGDEPAARRVLKAVVAGDEPVSFAAVDEVLAKLDAVEKRDDLLEALREDDFILFDTEAQTLRPASRLVPVWVRARAWGR